MLCCQHIYDTDTHCRVKEYVCRDKKPFSNIFHCRVFLVWEAGLNLQDPLLSKYQPIIEIAEALKKKQNLNTFRCDNLLPTPVNIRHINSIIIPETKKEAFLQ